MSNIIDLDKNKMREFLKSDEVTKVVELNAQKVFSRLGDGYKMDTHKGYGRVNVGIKAESKKAYYRNLKTNELEKALYD